jgi:hypothetical protein
MTIADLLKQSREIWGAGRMNLSDIIACMGVTFGDICRFRRDGWINPGVSALPDPIDLQKELGNMILSTIRWCDDLGYDPEECIRLAAAAQKKFVARGGYAPPEK